MSAKALKGPSLARSVPKPLKGPSLARSVPKPLKVPSLARSVPKPLKCLVLHVLCPSLSQSSLQTSCFPSYSYSSKHLVKLSGPRYSTQGIQGIFGVGEKSISVHKNFHVSLLSAWNLISEIII